jgi:hypothetical protein
MKQQSLQLTRHADLDALNAEFGRMLVRYRQLRSGTDAAAATPAPATAPAPATTP